MRVFDLGENMTEQTHKANTHRAYDVILNRRVIDTVFATYPIGYATKAEREDEQRRSLINHDGYNPSITVRERRQGR